MKTKNKGIKTGIYFFLVHFCVEVVCFATLKKYVSLEMAGIISLLYDFFAFVPQGLFGELMNKFRRFPMRTIGVVLMAAGVYISTFSFILTSVLGIMIMALGNAIIHEQGALETVAKGEGKIFPTALFVAGGSFGVVTGQIMGSNDISLLWLIIPLVIMEAVMLLSGGVEKDATYPAYDCVRFSDIPLSSPKFPIGLIVFVAFVITAVRGYIGYAIPISWKKEVWQEILLFSAMGLGKGLGGYLVDRFGARRVGVFSTLLAIPFLVFGENIMVISIIGVCLFSMTMCITFEMILSVIPKFPGIGFGVTTLALFVGCVPSFFDNPGRRTNIILVVVLSLCCAVLLFCTCNNKTCSGVKITGGCNDK